jgi:UMF1 family MFS transporter
METPVEPSKASFSERLLAAPAEASASGGRSASRLGQLSWAWFEGARNPHVLLITIYIFAPYFYTQLVGDPVHQRAGRQRIGGD